jgi:hypothetical protein
VTFDGGRSWWAHFEFTRVNVEPTIVRKKIEEQLIVAPFKLLRGAAPFRIG